MRVLHLEPYPEWQDLVMRAVTSALPEAHVTGIDYPSDVELMRPEDLYDVVIVGGSAKYQTANIPEAVRRLRKRIGTTGLIIVTSSRHTKDEVLSWGANHLVDRGDMVTRLRDLLCSRA